MMEWHHYASARRLSYTLCAADAECLCYSQEGRQFITIKSGIQISATQVILTVPDKGCVTSVALGGKDKDTLYAFCGNKIWKRKIQQHAMGALSPWTKVVPNRLWLRLAIGAGSPNHPLAEPV